MSLSTWSPTASNKPNTLLKHGGGPLNRVYQYLTRINLGLVSAEFEPEITTPTHFYDGALRMRDNDDDADLIFDNTDLDLDAGVNQYIKWPLITNVESGQRKDKAVLEKTAATLEQKTMILADNHVKANSAVAGDLTSFQDIGAGVIELRRLPKGTANQNLGMDGSGALAWLTAGANIGTGVITDVMNQDTLTMKVGRFNAAIGSEITGQGWFEGMYGLGNISNNLDANGLSNIWDRGLGNKLHCWDGEGSSSWGF